MFGFSKKCPVCEQLKGSNEYLRKLVDKLLEARGIEPVEPKNTETVEIPAEEPEGVLPKGAVRYGE